MPNEIRVPGIEGDTLSDLDIVLHTLLFLAEQGRQASMEGGCAYRVEVTEGTSRRTLKCAAGFWVPDEAYSAEVECGIIELGVGRKQAIIDALDPRVRDRLPLLRRLQRFHDTSKVWCGVDTFVEAVAHLLIGLECVDPFDSAAIGEITFRVLTVAAETRRQLGYFGRPS